MSQNIPFKKSKYQIEVYKENAPIFGSVLKELESDIAAKKIKPKDIASKFEEQCKNIWQEVSFPFKNVKNDYGYFDKSICLSVNSTVAHGDYNEIDFFNQGDLVTVDCGMSILIKSKFDFKRLHFDSAFTTIYGKNECSYLDKYNLLKTNLYCLKELNNKEIIDTYNLSSIIESIAAENGYGIIADLTGHGIGLSLHEAPKIYNLKTKYNNLSLFDGLVLCVEPIYTLGDKFTKVFTDSDGWTIKTVDGSLNSHFETMYLVEDGKLIDLVGISEWNI